MLPVPSRWSPGMPLKILQHTEKLPMHRITRPQMPVVLWLRNPGSNTETTVCILSAPKVAVRIARERGPPGRVVVEWECLGGDWVSHLLGGVPVTGTRKREFPR